LRNIADFIADRNAVGRDARYVRQLEKKLLLLVAACRGNTAKDVAANSFQTWRSQQRITAKTLNEYLNAATGLMNWMERTERIASNPMKSVQKAQSGGLQSRLRCAFTAQELKRLMAVAGPRKAIYLMAVFTGLRREELRQLQWGGLAPVPDLWGSGCHHLALPGVCEQAFGQNSTNDYVVVVADKNRRGVEVPQERQTDVRYSLFSIFCALVPLPPYRRRFSRFPPSFDEASKLTP